MNVINEFQNHRNQTRLSQYLNSQRAKKGATNSNVVRLSKNILNIANTTNKKTRREKVTELLGRIDNYEKTKLLLQDYINDIEEKEGNTHPRVTKLKKNFYKILDYIIDPKTTNNGNNDILNGLTPPTYHSVSISPPTYQSVSSMLGEAPSKRQIMRKGMKAYKKEQKNLKKNGKPYNESINNSNANTNNENNYEGGKRRTRKRSNKTRSKRNRRTTRK